MRIHYEKEFKLEIAKNILKGNIKVGEGAIAHNIQRTTVSRLVA